MTLERKAREFVGTLQDVLNGSITHGISLRYIGDYGGDVGYVGYQINRDDLTGSPFPVTIGRRNPTCWLWVNQTVILERDGNLKTTVARTAVFADEHGEQRLFSYDFDREAENLYPSAHIQVDANHHPAYEGVRDRLGLGQAFVDLHLPVGGVRFRPCLEDVIEFLVVEGMAEPRENWQTAVNDGRSGFHRIQLMAAVRNDPDAAASQLRSMGYQISPPEE